MALDIILLLVGFAALIKGANLFIDGTSSIADHFKVPKIFIGLTIVAFGTSAPELAISIKSILSNNFDIVIGDVFGSNILNILLIIGVVSLIKPLSVKNNTIKKEIPILLLISLLFGVLISDRLFNDLSNSFSRSDGIILLLFFLVFIYYLIEIAKHREKDINKEIKKMSLIKSFIYSIIGLALLIFGGNYVVNSASKLATSFGISEKIVGLTIIALGTSLPELVTSIIATKKGESDIAIGNIVGSCIFNIGIVMALPVAIFGGIDKINFNEFDIISMIIGVVLLYFFSANDRKISKKEGLLFLIFFIIYYGVTIFNG